MFLLEETEPLLKVVRSTMGIEDARIRCFRGLIPVTRVFPVYNNILKLIAKEWARPEKKFGGFYCPEEENIP